MSGPVSSAPLPWKWFALWVAGFALLTAPLVWSTRPTNLSSDEASYYLPAIQQIRAHWPKLDLVSDSLSATSPVYPYFLASCSLLIGPSTTAMRLVNWAVSLGLIALLWVVLQRRGGWPLTLALLPLALSNFFVKSSGYVVTDNAALLAIAGSLVVLFFRPTRTAIGPASGLAATSVAVRQMNIWLLAPLALRALQDLRTTRRWSGLLWLCLPLIPLGVLWQAWGGLVPPIWQNQLLGQSTVSGTPLIYSLIVLLTLGPAYYLVATNPTQWKEDFQRPWIWGLGLLGFALALVCPSVPDHAAGRWGGYWWNLAGHLPLFGQISLLFLVLAPLGAMLAGLLLHRLWREAGREFALLYFVTIAAWAAATLANRLVFHRYYEPPILLFLILWLALLATARPGFHLARRWPLVLLAVGQLFVTLLTTHTRVFGLFGLK